MESFYQNQKGGVMPLVGLSLTMLVGLSGMAIDMERAQQVQTKLSSSLDAAGLAAAATINTTSLSSEAQKYLEANFQDYLGSEITDFTATANDDNSVVTLNATAEMPTRLLTVLGIDSQVVSASSEITRANKGLELVMVLDNTGSMSGSKLANLKTASTDLVNILYGDKTESEHLHIGLVPFSQAVNIGSQRSSWLNGSSFNWSTTSWNGCVEARLAGNEDITDTPPTIEPFTPYYWACHRDYNGWWGTNSNRNNCRTDGTIRYRTDIGVTRGPNKNCSQAVTALTSSKATILNAINSMEARGFTHINLGAVWGWRMLSPRWRGLWGGEMNSKNLPLNYNTDKMEKAAIIMTDGDNTMNNAIDTAYGYLWERQLGTGSSSTARNRLNDRLTRVCNAMKQNNIVVYTISFGNLSTSSRNMMRGCASQSDFYFDSPTNSDLQQAFKAIADSLASLRVSR
jgi:Flp pilus assembly protein TadG